MMNILFYLFEHYLPDACPDSEVLARKLVAAGFEDEEISEAIDWLAGFNAAPPPALAVGKALRLYHPSEAARLPVECRGFLAFLEQAGAIDATTRELVVDRVLALADEEIPLAKLKGIVLMVIWRQQLPLDALILEELLEDDYSDDGIVEARGAAAQALFH